MSDRVLVDLQEDIVERLLSDSFFTTIPVLSERVAELDFEIEAGLGITAGRGGKVGALVIVQQPTAIDEMPEVTFGALDTQWTILVMEDTKINRDAVIGTLKPALEIARRVIRVLKHTYFGGGRTGGAGRIMRPGSPVLAPAAALVVSEGGTTVPVSYAVKFICAEADSEVFTKVARPTISPNGGAGLGPVTLACSTASSAIYYSVDGSYPRSGGGGSLLYATPITLLTACTLRVAAYKTGSIPSDVVAADFTE